ncbi:MAG: hypothetical protein AUH74_03925 [Nitrospirae bacterium 13_1_40CM_4_62_6]|nr:MAG: hypothetical protein AUH74_03925 [Nitrospirae bacterium 13_1_40CM_4_62_6]
MGIAGRRALGWATVSTSTPPFATIAYVTGVSVSFPPILAIFLDKAGWSSITMKKSQGNRTSLVRRSLVDRVSWRASILC